MSFGSSEPSDTILADDVAASHCGLRYRFRIVSPSAPLLYLVHGRVGNLDLMWTFRRRFPHEWNVISVEAPLADSEGALKGYSWWNIGSEKALLGGPRAWREYLSPFIRRVEEYHRLQPTFRVGIGFSQGGALLSVGAQVDPDFFSGVGLLASFVVTTGEAVKRSGDQKPRVFIAHGTEDLTVPLSKAEEGATYLRDSGFNVEFVTDPVGHKLGTQGMRALGEWLLSFGVS